MINLLEKAIDAMSFIFQIHQKDRLVGGFNPFEIGNLPQIGLKIKKNETTTQTGIYYNCSYQLTSPTKRPSQRRLGKNNDLGTFALRKATQGD